MLQCTGYLVLSTKTLAYIGAYIQAISEGTMIELLQALDWSAEATFVAAAFGGELLLGMVKKVFAKKGERTDEIRYRNCTKC